MKPIITLILSTLLWMGVLPIHAQLEQDALFFSNQNGIWKIDSTTHRAELWMINTEGTQYRALAVLSDGTVLIVNTLDGTLYQVHQSQRALTNVLQHNGETIAIDAVFDVVITPDENEIIFVDALSSHWYSYDRTTQMTQSLYADEGLRSCGNQILALDEALLNPFRFFAGWHSDTLFMPLNCRDGVGILQNDALDPLILGIKTPRQDETRQYLVGGYEGALAVFSLEDGELQALNFDFITQYQNWWWYDEAIIFSIVTPSQTLDFLQFADETLADLLLGGQYAINEPFLRYDTTLYYWAWRSDEPPQEFFSRSNTRGTESLVVNDTDIYFVMVDSAYDLMEALQGERVNNVGGAIIPPTYEALQELIPQQHVFLTNLTDDVPPNLTIGTGYGLIGTR